MRWEPGGTLPRPVRRVVEESGVAFADFIGWSTRSFDEANQLKKFEKSMAFWKDPPFWSNFYTIYQGCSTFILSIVDIQY